MIVTNLFIHMWDEIKNHPLSVLYSFLFGYVVYFLYFVGYYGFFSSLELHLQFILFRLQDFIQLSFNDPTFYDIYGSVFSAFISTTWTNIVFVIFLYALLALFLFVSVTLFVSYFFQIQKKNIDFKKLTKKVLKWVSYFVVLKLIILLMNLLFSLTGPRLIISYLELMAIGLIVFFGTIDIISIYKKIKKWYLFTIIIPLEIILYFILVYFPAIPILTTIVSAIVFFAMWYLWLQFAITLAEVKK